MLDLKINFAELHPTFKVCLSIRGLRQCATIANYTGLRLKRCKILLGCVKRGDCSVSVVTIQRAVSHSRRQSYLKHFLIPGDEVIKIALVLFPDATRFLPRCRA